MNTPDPAPAPNPYAVAGAQTGSNIGTALANTMLGNANEYTPWGNVEYTQSGNFTTITDPATGQTYQIPQYNRTTTLSQRGRSSTTRTSICSTTCSSWRAARSGG